MAIFRDLAEEVAKDNYSYNPTADCGTIIDNEYLGQVFTNPLYQSMNGIGSVEGTRLQSTVSDKGITVIFKDQKTRGARYSVNPKLASTVQSNDSGKSSAWQTGLVKADNTKVVHADVTFTGGNTQIPTVLSVVSINLNSDNKLKVFDQKTANQQTVNTSTSQQPLQKNNINATNKSLQGTVPPKSLGLPKPSAIGVPLNQIPKNDPNFVYPSDDKENNSITVKNPFGPGTSIVPDPEISNTYGDRDSSKKNVPSKIPKDDGQTNQGTNKRTGTYMITKTNILGFINTGHAWGNINY